MGWEYQGASRWHIKGRTANADVYRPADDSCFIVVASPDEYILYDWSGKNVLGTFPTLAAAQVYAAITTERN